MASKSSNDLSLLLVAKLDPKASEDAIKAQLDALKAKFANTKLEIKLQINKESLDSLKEMAQALKQVVSLQGKVRANTGVARSTVSSNPVPRTFKPQDNEETFSGFTHLFRIQQDGHEKLRQEERRNYELWWQEKEKLRAETARKAEEQSSKDTATLEKMYADEEAAKKAERDKADAAVDKWMNSELAKEAEANKKLLEVRGAAKAEEIKNFRDGIVQTAEAQNIEAKSRNEAHSKVRKDEESYLSWWEQTLQKEDTLTQKDSERRAKEAKSIKDAQAKDEKKKTQDAKKAYDDSFAGKFGKAFDAVTIWTTVTSTIFGSIRAIKDGFAQITEIDTAMTDLKKVTDESAQTYAEFSRQANVMGNSLGSSTVEIIKATAEFSRLGYSLEQAKTLAGQATLYSNVGGMDVQTASQNLISTVKGFGMEIDTQGKNVAHVVDVYNEVGNNFAITSAGIGQAVSRSASSLSEAGNTMEQSVAMITAANSTIQDPETVGTALKTVAMRLRGVDEAGDPVLGMTAKLEKNFQNIGLSLMKDNNTFKSTYEVMQDLSTVWGKLNDIQRADILEQVAGKRQGNVVAGMLNNWSDAEKALNSAMNSFGSAAKENETYMDSIEAKQKQAANAVTGFWQATLSGVPVKAALTGFSLFIKVLTMAVDAFGGIPTVVGTVAFALAAYTLAAGAASAATAAGTGMIGMFGNAWTALAGKVMAAGGVIKFVQGVLVSSVIGAAVAVIVAGLSFLVTKVTEAYKAHDNLVKKLEEQVTAGEKTQTSLNALATEYENLAKKADLTAQEKERLVSIQAEMADQLPELIRGYDSEGRAIYANADETRQYIKELQKATAEKAHLLALENQQSYGDMANKINEVKPLADRGNDTIAQQKAKLEGLKLAQELAKDMDPKSEDIYGKVALGMEKIKEIYAKAGLDTKKAVSDINLSVLAVHKDQIGDLIAQSEKALADTSVKVGTARETATTEIAKFKQDLYRQAQQGDANLEKPNKQVDVLKKLMIDSIAEMVKRTDADFSKASNQFYDSWQKFIGSVNGGKVNLDEIVKGGDGANQALMDLRTQLEAANMPAMDLDRIIAYLRDNMDRASVKTYDFKNAVSSLVGDMKDTGNNVDALAKAYRQLENGQHLSLEEMNNLISKNKQLIGAIEEHDGALSLNLKAIKDVALAEGDSTRVKIVEEQKRAEAAKQGAIAEIKAALAKIGAEKEYQRVMEAGAAKSSQIYMEKYKQQSALAGPDSADNPWANDQAITISYDVGLITDAEASLKGIQGMLDSFNPTSMWNAAYNDAVDHNKDPKAKKDDAQHDPFNVNSWEHNITALQLELTKLEIAKKKYTETDKEFLDLQRQEIDINKRIQGQYADEAATIRGTVIPALDAQMAQYAVHSKEWDQLAQKRDEQVKRTEQLSQSWWGIEGKIQDVLGGNAKKRDWLGDIKKELADTQKLFDDQINQSQARQAALDKNSTGYRDELHAQNKILSERVAYEDWVVKLLKEEQAQLEQRMKTENMTGSVLQAVKARLLDIKGVIADTTKGISAQNETIAKNSAEWWDSMKAWRKQAEQLADKVVQTYKDVQKAIHDAQLASLDEVTKAEDQRHNDVIKNADEESKKFEEVINDKIKLMDREWQNKQDKKNLDKEQENRDKLQTEIDKLALDNSVEGRAKVDDLRTKLKEQDSKLQDMRDKKTHDERKDNLTTELDEYKRNKDTEKKTEDDRHAQEVKHFDELKKQYDEQYDKAVNNEEKIQKLRQAVFDGDMNYINGQLNTYFGAFDDLADTTMKGIGQKIRDNLDLAQKLQDTLDSVNGTNGQTPLPSPPGTDDNNTQGNSGSAITDQSGTVNSDGLRKVQAYEEIVSNKINAAAYYKESGSWDDPRIKALAARNLKLRTDFGIGDFSSEEAQAQWDTVKDGGWDRYVKNKRKWWLLYKEVGGTSSPQQLELAKDNERLRRMFGFADLSQDDLKLMGELPFDRNERDKALQTMIANKLEWKKDRSKLDAITDPQEKAKIQDEMAKLANDNKTIRGDHNDIHDYSDAELRKLNVAGFSVGGFTGKWAGAGGRVIAVHPEEFVLNKADTKNILAAVHVMRDLLNSPNLFQKQSAPAPAGVTIGQISLTIERLNGDEQGGKTVFKTIIDELNRTKGVRI